MNCYFELTLIIAARLVDKYWQALLFASHAAQALPVLRVTVAARLVDNLTTGCQIIPRA